MNIADLLRRYAKEGDVFYTTIGGDIPFLGVGCNGTIRISEDGWCDLDSEGRLMSDGECVIFPSRENRDWEKWMREKSHKELCTDFRVGLHVEYDNHFYVIEALPTRDHQLLLRDIVSGGGLKLASTTTVYKLEHFRADLLHPFDKVLVRDADDRIWVSDFFCYKRVNEKVFRGLNGISWKQCVPYNSETKHLLGTADNAPEFYNQTSINIK